MFDIVSFWSTAKRVLTHSLSHLTSKKIFKFSIFHFPLPFPILIFHFCTTYIFRQRKSVWYVINLSRREIERERSLSLSLMQSAWNGNGIWQSITQNAMQHMSAMSWSLKLHYTHVCTCIYVYIFVCIYIKYACSTCPNKSDQSWVAPAHNEAFNGERSLKLFE